MFDTFERRRSGWFITFIVEPEVVEEVATRELEDAMEEFYTGFSEISGFDTMKKSVLFYVTQSQS